MAVVGLGAAAVSRLLFVPVTPDVVVINEVMASNGSVVSDDDDDFEDWVELYNPTAAPITLAGYSLSDSPAEPRQWRMPDVVVPAKGHTLVWASGKSYWYLPDRHPSDPVELEFVSAGRLDGDTVELLWSTARTSPGRRLGCTLPWSNPMARSRMHRDSPSTSAPRSQLGYGMSFSRSRPVGW